MIERFNLLLIKCVGCSHDGRRRSLSPWFRSDLINNFQTTRNQHQVISDKTKNKRQYRAQPISTFFGATFLPLRGRLNKIYLQWKSSKFQLNRFSKTNLMQTNLLLFFHHGAQGKPKDDNAPLIMIILWHGQMIVKMIITETFLKINCFAHLDKDFHEI